MKVVATVEFDATEPTLDNVVDAVLVFFKIHKCEGLEINGTPLKILNYHYRIEDK